MPTNRKIVFLNDHAYHIFNRGVERRPTFTNKYEYLRALETIIFYQYSKIPIRLSEFLDLSIEDKNTFLNSVQTTLKLQVKIVSYCLMPNHFHFLLLQKEENGISCFIANFTNSYTKYFNIKEKRVGPLFQGVFKATHIETTEQLIHVSRYIHINPVTFSLINSDELENYLWSSYYHYLDNEKDCFVNKKVILDQFPSIKAYKQFVMDHISYAKELEKIKHLILEDK